MQEKQQKNICKTENYLMIYGNMQKPDRQIIQNSILGMSMNMNVV